MAALALACTVLLCSGCSKNENGGREPEDKIGGSATLGDISHSVTSAVAIYSLSEDWEGNRVYEYNIYLMFDGLTLEAMINGAVSMPSAFIIAMTLPEGTYEFPVGTFIAEEDTFFPGVIYLSEKDQLESETSSCTLTIGRSGTNYTFDVSGETTDGQPVTCHYTGPVEFVDIDSLI